MQNEILQKMFLADITICFLFAVTLTQMEETDYDDEDIRLPEEATGRPMPPELLYMFGNKSARNVDLEDCMGELVDCHRLQHELSQMVCGRHASARKTFKDICELNYENCKAPIIEPELDQVGGPEHLNPITVNPEVVLWAFAHDGECSEEVN